MTRFITRTTIALLLAALLSLAMTTAMVVPASAEHDGGEEAGVSDMLTPSDDGYLASFVAGLGGGLDRILYRINGPEDSAEENRDQAVKEWNQHNETFIPYANNRSLHEGEVVQIDCVIEGETATGYIVAEYNNSTGEYDSAEAVASTDRSADHTVVLEANACDNAAEEIEYFHSEFASQDKDVTQTYMTKMAAKYGKNVDEPFTGGS